jgi:hypothetical protein
MMTVADQFVFWHKLHLQNLKNKADPNGINIFASAWPAVVKHAMTAACMRDLNQTQK